MSVNDHRVLNQIQQMNRRTCLNRHRGIDAVVGGTQDHFRVEKRRRRMVDRRYLKERVMER